MITIMMTMIMIIMAWKKIVESVHDQIDRSQEAFRWLYNYVISTVRFIVRNAMSTLGSKLNKLIDSYSK